ncbi:DUF883 family protein [Pedosphaera parvula]|uniref:DUF883 domain-containing protein n=1 Tax=Pedosphaera parvula (strain Ellin514) TaxID=320771 RepID=B9XEB4_PEDPL|nr:DUF883 family protein [Pedosphaera parvula]EEF61628.1 protein of unknown function DUF883 ElaB [Pedosphaera parvula Ellin514]
MNTQNGLKENMEDMMDDASTLLNHTDDMTDDSMVQARKQLAEAMEQVRNAYEVVQKKAVEGAKATDKAIRNNPYAAIGIAAGVGVLIGYLISRRK